MALMIREKNQRRRRRQPQSPRQPKKKAGDGTDPEGDDPTHDDDHEPLRDPDEEDDGEDGAPAASARAPKKPKKAHSEPPMKKPSAKEVKKKPSTATDAVEEASCYLLEMGKDMFQVTHWFLKIINSD